VVEQFHLTLISDCDSISCLFPDPAYLLYLNESTLCGQIQECLAMLKLDKPSWQLFLSGVCLWYDIVLLVVRATYIMVPHI